MKTVHVGDLIRRISTEEPWLVVSITSVGMLICNLTDANNPRALSVLLPGDFDHWKPDKETEVWQ